jgi:hypothetical protein
MRIKNYTPFPMLCYEARGIGDAPFDTVVVRATPALGMGFAPSFSLEGKDRVEAPRIEDPDAPVTELGKSYRPEGVGVWGRTWPPRRERGHVRRDVEEGAVAQAARGLRLHVLELTDSAQKALGAKPGDMIKITFKDGTTQIRRYDDRAPESDERVDLYNRAGWQKGLSDFGAISLVKP